MPDCGGTELDDRIVLGSRGGLREQTCFNHRRLLEPIGNIPAAEAEERYYAMLDDTPMAA